jgi:hypothetical protein
MIRHFSLACVVGLFVCAHSLGGDDPTVDGKPLKQWLAGLKDKDAAVRLEAVLALEEFGARHKEVVPALAEATTDKDAQVRETAIKVLAGFGDGAKEAVPALVQALKDKQDDVRISAVAALSRIGILDKPVLDGLMAVLVGEHQQSAPRPPRKYWLGPTLPPPSCFSKNARIRSRSFAGGCWSRWARSKPGPRK